MIGKLIKYEIKSSILLMSAIWASVIASSVLVMITGFISKHASNAGLGGIIKMLFTVPRVLYYLIIGVLIIGTIAIIINRFYQGLLKEEGYFVHTLPVKTWKLIASKAITAICYILLSGLACVISLCIIGVIAGPDIPCILSNIWNVITTPKTLLICLEGILLGVLGLLATIYEIYASLALGQLSNEHKGIFSIISYIGINIVGTILIVLLVIAENSLHLSNILDGLSDFQAEQLILVGLLIVITALIAAYHLITERILRTKLNLQ